MRLMPAIEPTLAYNLWDNGPLYFYDNYFKSEVELNAFVLWISADVNMELG